MFLEKRESITPAGGDNLVNRAAKLVGLIAQIEEVLQQPMPIGLQENCASYKYQESCRRLYRDALWHKDDLDDALSDLTGFRGVFNGSAGFAPTDKLPPVQEIYETIEALTPVLLEHKKQGVEIDPDEADNLARAVMALHAKIDDISRRLVKRGIITAQTTFMSPYSTLRV